MGEFSKLSASNQLYKEYVTPTERVTKDFDQGETYHENDDSNYDLTNPIYRAGYRYALQQVQIKIDAMKNECFTTAIQTQKEKL
jgi:hypothetical protein